jgi:hypothetical protein
MSLALCAVAKAPRAFNVSDERRLFLLINDDDDRDNTRQLQRPRLLPSMRELLSKDLKGASPRRLCGRPFFFIGRRAARGGNAPAFVNVEFHHLPFTFLLFM